MLPDDAVSLSFPDQRSAVARFAGPFVLRLTELYNRLTGDNSFIHSDTEHQRFFDSHPELAKSLKDAPRHFMIHGKIVEGVAMGLFRRQFSDAGGAAAEGLLLSGSKCANLAPVYYGDVVSYEVRSFIRTGRPVSKSGFHEYALSGEAYKKAGGRRIDVLLFELTGAVHESLSPPTLPLP